MIGNLVASLPRPWIRHYPAEIGSDLLLDHGDMLSAFRAVVGARPGGVALRYFDRSVTYAAIDGDSDGFACWLADRGVSGGDRVAIIVQNIPAFPVAALAAWKLGAVPLPINPMYRRQELSRILADARPSAILCQDLEREEVAAAMVLADLADIPLVIVSPRDGQGRNDARILPPRVSHADLPVLEDILGQNAGRVPPTIGLASDDLGLLLYTSGTTGLPKGAMLSHRSLVFNAQFMREWCALTDEAHILAIAPLFHITGFVCHMCTAICAGGDMLLGYRFEPSVALDMIREYRPTFTIGTITAFNALMRVPGLRVEDMASFKRIYSGGAPVPPALREELGRAFGVEIYPCYGMTETAAPALFAPHGAPVPIRSDTLSVGVPIPSTEICVVGEDGHPVTSGEVGEILIRGPQVMTAYWNKPDETGAALHDGWMHSGDVGFMDEEGWFYLVDRKKDVIIASGFKVWPREVEDVLYQVDMVREAAVVGVPDDYRGETVKAFVSAKPGCEIDVDRLVRHCREHLAAYKVPRAIEVLAELPKTATGKIQRVTLKDVV